MERRDLTGNTLNMSELAGKTHFVFKCSECLHINEMLSHLFNSLNTETEVLLQHRPRHAPPLCWLCLALHDVCRPRISLTPSFVFCHL